MRSAIVEDGVVVNIIIGALEGSVPCADDVAIGWTFDGDEFSPPAPPEPEPEDTAPPPLTARQLRLGLIAAGISIAAVDGAIAAIPDPADREVAQVEWQYASQFERDHHLIGQIGAALGLTEEQIDAAWLAAADL